MAYLVIIDDDEDLARATARILRDGGHEVGIKLDVRSALESMEKRRPDLVLLDATFPEDCTAASMLARTMRQHKKREDVPILMLTAVNARSGLELSRHDIDDHWLPVVEFVEEPVDLDELPGRADALLDKPRSGSGVPLKRHGNDSQARRLESSEGRGPWRL